jgi:hypothetical protein
VCGAHPRNRNITDIIFLHLFLLKTPLIVCWLRVIPKIKSNIQCFMKRRSFCAYNLHCNSVNSPGVRSQIRTPSGHLNRCTDGAASEILRLRLVLNCWEGVAGWVLREKHTYVVSGCDWLLCEANLIQRFHLSRVMIDHLADFLNML